MIHSTEYSIEFPLLFQLKGSHKILFCDEEKKGAYDSLGNLFPVDQYEPIPLSFWWLRVLGFRHVFNKFHEEYTFDNETGQRFSVFRNSAGKWFYMPDNEPLQISYVHELQTAHANFRSQPA